MGDALLCTYYYLAVVALTFFTRMPVQNISFHSLVLIFTKSSNTSSHHHTFGLPFYFFFRSPHIFPPTSNKNEPNFFASKYLLVISSLHMHKFISKNLYLHIILYRLKGIHYIQITNSLLFSILTKVLLFVTSTYK